MRRRLLVLFLLAGLVAVVLPAVLMAQDVPPPAATEDPFAPQPTVETPVIEPTAGEPVAVQTPEPLPPAPPASPIPQDALSILINVRNDLELLASQALQGGRPVGWSGSLDIQDSQLPLLMRLDLELLAGTALGVDQRPPGWFGAIPSTTYAIARDVRHDLELLADTLNTPNVRPPGWAGGDPLMRCDRGIQTLIMVLEKGGVFQLTVDLNDPNFCTLAELQASQFAEVNILSQPVVSIPTGNSGGSVPGEARIDGEFAVAFLDRFATQQVGQIPLGEAITPVARSYTQFSRMMLVRGNGFEVFMDYRDSTLTDDQFNALPNIDGITANPSCSAGWCGAPVGAG